MKLARLSPLRTPLRETVDRLFDPFFSGALMQEPFLRNLPEPTDWLPPINLAETDKEFVVRIEVPGMHKENLDVNLTGDVLAITGHREAAREIPGETSLYAETEVGRFLRTIRMPAPVVEGKVEATYLDGVLNIRLPKAEPVVKNRIAIK